MGYSPFDMPAMEYVMSGEEGREKVREASLWKVSVVQIDLAVVSLCRMPQSASSN